MTTGTEIMRRAGILLNDEGFDRWTPPELREWINDGLKAIVLLKPSAKSGTRVLSLVAGTLQSVTTAAGQPEPVMLLDIIRNVLSIGPVVPGRAIKATSRTQLDAADPNWHMNTGATRYQQQVRHFTYDEQNPLEFYVYPGNDGTGKVEALCSEIPTMLEKADATDGTSVDHYADVIDLPAIYDPVLVDYICYRSQSKDDPAAGGGLSTKHQLAFANALGVKIQVEGASSPNNKRSSP